MKKKIAIITDSNSGITPDEARSLGVYLVAMPFLVNGESYFENENLTQDNFYELLKTGDNVSTSQPSLGMVAEIWQEALKTHDEVVYIPMSSGLSQSCANAKNMANEYGGKVFVVDNHRISVTQKESVLDALKLKERGKDGKQICAYLEETASQASIYIAVDTMKYLKKGGRVTPAAAMVGSILRLNPVLQIQGEKLDKFALSRGMHKARETMKSALKKDVETTYAKYVENGELYLYVAHTANEENAKQLAQELQEMFPNIPFRFCEPLSLSIACHTGPGALGVGCCRFLK